MAGCTRLELATSDVTGRRSGNPAELTPPCFSSLIRNTLASNVRKPLFQLFLNCCHPRAPRTPARGPLRALHEQAVGHIVVHQARSNSWGILPGMEPTANTQPILCTSDAHRHLHDSGFGGAYCRARHREEAAERIPHLSGRFRAGGPYGPRHTFEVDGFVQQIGSWLVSRGVKMIVIACNTATAAGLSHAQQTLPYP